MNYSIKTVARCGGLLYLINILLGFFAIGVVPEMIVAKDAHTTAQNLIQHEQLFRLGFVAHLIILLTNIPLALVWWKLFTPVSKTITLGIIFITLVATAVEISNQFNQLASLVVLNGSQLSAFSKEQLDSIGFMFHRLQIASVNVAFFYFGFYGISAGYLIVRSTFFPKFIGVLMATGGTCYIIYSVTVFLAPASAAQMVPYILIPSGLSELVFCLWLLIRGVNTKKWQEKSSSFQSTHTATPIIQ